MNPLNRSYPQRVNPIKNSQLVERKNLLVQEQNPILSKNSRSFKDSSKLQLVDFFPFQEEAS